jgi:DNA-binding transcriptional regulator YdaS (Cro superfamily)
LQEWLACDLQVWLTMTPMRSSALQEAVRRKGSVSALARAIGVRPQAISQWDRVPADRVIAVEKETGVSRHELRPDLYPPEPAARKRAAA